MGGHVAGGVSDGVVLASFNDAVNANKSLELRGSPIVLSQGNVAIGSTIAPVSLLSVNGNGATGYTFYVNAGTSGLAGRVYMSGLTTASAATSADLCLSGSEVVNDSALCVVSARRFKNTIEDSPLGLALIESLVLFALLVVFAVVARV